MIIDIVLCAIVLILFLIGIIRGFFKSLPRIVRVAIALCLTICVSSVIIENFTGPYLRALAAIKIEEYIIFSCPDINFDTATAVLPTVLILITKIFGISITVDNTENAEELIRNLSVLIGDPLGTVVAMILTYAVLFILFYILLKILLKICDSLFSYGILRTVNKICGGVMGIATGCVISCTIANVIAQFFPQYAVGCGVPYYFFLKFNPLAFLFSF